MKRWIVLLAMLGLIVTVGCGDNKKDPTVPDDNSDYDGTISATIAGDLSLDFNCTTAYGLAEAGAGGATGSMHIQGIVTQGTDEYMIDIQVYHDPATGTYQLDFPPVDGVGTVAKNNTGNISESGSVTFTQVSSSHLVGTFSFTAFRIVEGVGKVTVTVTDGTFNVPVITIG
jgi:hypothetical protein